MGRDAERVLRGRRIIITRSVADNRSLRDALAVRGADVIDVPLIEVLPPADGGTELRAAVDRLEEFDWVALTSVNAVDALVRAFLAGEHDRPWPSGLRAAVVGPTTAAAATTAGLIVALEPETATAAALVDAFPPSSESTAQRVLAPLAELASQTIVDGLTAKGHRVERVTAYRTDAPAAEPAHGPDSADAPAVDALAVAGADAVTFFSPSAVDRFIARFDGRPDLAVCIGPSTAARATERGFPEVETAEEHTERAVIDLLGVLLGEASD